VVVKGDNPVTIARHFHVDYDALLQLNQIEDPRRLQIGQKLHIPKRSETSKHKSD
jgi:LysM repeat protein